MHVVELPRGRRNVFNPGAWHHLAMTYDGRDLVVAWSASGCVEAPFGGEATEARDATGGALPASGRLVLGEDLVYLVGSGLPLGRE